MDKPQDTLFEFPCDVPIKIFGKNDPQLIPHVLMITRKHFPMLKDEALISRPSKQSNYLGLTVTVLAENKPQLDALYQDLSKDPLVLMAM